MAAAQKSTPTFDVSQQYLANVYFQDGLRLTVVLCALLYLVLATSLDAAGHVREGLGILLPVTLGSLFLSTMMAFSRFDSFFAFSHSMFTGLAWILFLMAQQVSGKEADLQTILDRGVPDLQARAYFVLLRLLSWLDAAVNDKPSADNLVFVFEIALLIWWLSYLGIWSIIRHGYTWRAVIPAGMVLVINTYYAPKPVFFFLFLFALIGLILLVRTNLAEKQRIWREQRIYFSQDITWDFMRNGLYYAIAVLALAVLIPNLGRNPVVRQALTPLSDQWNKTQQEVSKLYGDLNRRVTNTSQAGFGSQMQLGGERNVGNTWLFSVRAIQPRYWRAVVYDEYTGRGWRNSGELSHQFEAGELIPVPAWSSRHEISQTVTVLAPLGTTIVGAPDIRSASIPIQSTIGGAPVEPFFGASADVETETGAVELTWIRTTRDLDVGDRYVVYSNETDATIEEMRQASTDYPQSILDTYLQLPENFSEKVRQLAATTIEGITTTDGVVTAYDKAKAIESYLRTLEYDETIAAPGVDVDPLEYFLFEIRRGYCDYYASSMATMLRSLGIPARAVSGYAEGLWDEESGDYFVSERDAHTWVEVFFPNLGWIEFEPTAGESALNRRESNAAIDTTIQDNELPQNAGAEPEPTFDPFQQQNQPEEDQLPEGALQITTGGSLIPWWAWIILTPLLLGLGLWVLWRLQMGAPSDFTPEIPPILYERMQRWAERLRLGAPSHYTPFEQERRLVKALPQIQQPIQVVTRSFVNHQYAPQKLNAGNSLPPGEESRLMEAWRTLLPAFIKEWASQLNPWRGSGKLTNGTDRRHFDIDGEVHFIRNLRQTKLGKKKGKGG